MKKVILDTNFLLIPSYFRVDIFSEIKRIMNDSYELFITQKTKEELTGITGRQKGASKAAARMALELIEKKGIRTAEYPLQNPSCKQKSLYTPSISLDNITVDDIILEIADEDTIVATQDKGLKEKLKEKKIKLIVLRNKKYLELV